MYKLEHVPTNRHQLVHRITIWIWILVHPGADMAAHELNGVDAWVQQCCLWPKMGKSGHMCGQHLPFFALPVLSLGAFKQTHIYGWRLPKWFTQTGTNHIVSQKKHLRLLPSFVQNLHIHSNLCSQMCVCNISLPVWIGIGKWQSSRGWWRWVDNDDDEGEVGGDPHHPVQGDHLVQGDEEEEEEEGEEGWGVERWCWVTGKPPLWVGSCSWNLILSYQYIVILDQIYSDHQWRPLMTWTIAPAGPPTLGWQR